MLYLFAYLSVLTPTIFLQTRVIDTPLAPTIGALTFCLFRACFVIPEIDTTLYDFVREIPDSGWPTVDAPPQERVLILGGMDDDGAPPHNIAQAPHRPDVKPFSWTAPQDTSSKSLISPLASYLSTRPNHSVNTTVQPRNVTSPTNPHVEITSTNSNLPEGLWSDRDKFLALTSSGSLGRNGSMFNFNGVPINRTAYRATASPLAIRLPSTPSYLLALRCMESDKALYLLNETCSHIVSSNITHNLPQILASPTMTVGSPSLNFPRSLLSDKALYLLNNTCPSAPTFVNESPKKVVKTESSVFDTPPFRPISTLSLPCLFPNKIRRGAPRSCGFYAQPSIGMALDWDIKSQAALLKPYITEEGPIFFLSIADPDYKPSTCPRRRDPSFGAGVCNVAVNHKSAILPVFMPVSQKKYIPFFNNSHLYFMRIRHTAIAITLAVLILFSAIQTGKMKNIRAGDSCITVKVEEASALIITTLRHTSQTALSVKEEIIVPEVADLNIKYIPVSTAAKTAPPRGKARMVAGRRVQPARKCKTPPPTEASGKKGHDSKTKRS
ncbi:hypothetical protein BDZ94DRAFT_1318014 [Collybia nuda]|uniref:Uncharacterized protein n=1 Tax=Collybia nuda TaxID=64659 RepID=A0A9P5YIR6_9AGAR|nr:hypothetical protein BDZ94DRAFT_1318014 [Collybia nuda]